MIGFVKAEELICKCGECKDIPEELQPHVNQLLKELNVLRAALKKPLIVNSGVRCPAHNKSVGGEPNSRHLKGQAADLRVVGMSPQRLAGFIEGLMSSHELVDGGLGTYEHFVHFDIGPSRRW